VVALGVGIAHSDDRRESTISSPASPGNHQGLPLQAMRAMIIFDMQFMDIS
jgi:hypothetical protein